MKPSLKTLGVSVRSPFRKESASNAGLLISSRVFLFGIRHPSIGRQLAINKYRAWRDSKKSVVAHQYEWERVDVGSALATFFPGKALLEFHNQVAPTRLHVTKFLEEIGKKKFPSKEKPYPTDFSLDPESGLFLYALCKMEKPQRVLETGVAYGLSSSFILQALHENEKGRLYSLDSIFRPWQSKGMIGAAIPSELRRNWQLVLGSSSRKLNDILESISPVDVFFHDSLHTYRNMLFEFETAWPHIRSGGFLISDDVTGNNAFYDFCKKADLTPVLLMQEKGSTLGILRKP